MNTAQPTRNELPPIPQEVLDALAIPDLDRIPRLAVSERVAARILGYESARKLQVDRVKGQGLPFLRCGRNVRYLVPVLARALAEGEPPTARAG